MYKVRTATAHADKACSHRHRATFRTYCEALTACQAVTASSSPSSLPRYLDVFPHCPVLFRVQIEHPIETQDNFDQLEQF